MQKTLTSKTLLEGEVFETNLELLDLLPADCQLIIELQDGTFVEYKNIHNGTKPVKYKSQEEFEDNYDSAGCLIQMSLTMEEEINNIFMSVKNNNFKAAYIFAV
jgi:hypothetical protein